MKYIALEENLFKLGTGLLACKELYTSIRRKRIVPAGHNLFIRIMGGAIRDYLLDKPINDIDVYIYTKNVTDVCSFIKKHLLDAGFENIEGTFDPLVFDYNYSNHIVYIVSATKNKVPMQFILINIPPLDFMEKTFSVGISKVGLRIQSNKIITSEDFENDVSNQTITIIKDSIPTHNEFAFEKSKKYINKIHEKYPTYKLVAK